MQLEMKNCLRAAGAEFADSNDASVLHFGDPKAEYHAIVNETAIADVSDRTLIALTGTDRHSFLHNLCTNEIRSRQAGSGCEAFLCSAQGRILFYVNVIAKEDALLLDTVAGQNEPLIAHLDRYLIREDVQLADRTAECGALLVAGPESESSVARLVAGTLPDKPLEIRDLQFGRRRMSFARVAWTSQRGFLLICASDETPELWQALVDAGAAPCGEEAMQVARIEAGIPLPGLDVTETNLPQEVGRDSETISFTKGCYLGQETVARIDALGHVNRLLAGVRFGGTEVPPGGTELRADDKTVGTVTSAAFSYALDSPLALAYVRRERSEPGTALESTLGTAKIVALPVRSSTA